MRKSIVSIGSHGAFLVWGGTEREVRRGEIGPAETACISESASLTEGHAAAIVFSYEIGAAGSYPFRIRRRNETGARGFYTITITSSPKDEELAKEVPMSAAPIVLNGRVFIRMEYNSAMAKREIDLENFAANQN
jgi:hypothetical protein